MAMSHTSGKHISRFKGNEAIFYPRGGRMEPGKVLEVDRGSDPILYRIGLPGGSKTWFRENELEPRVDLAEFAAKKERQRLQLVKSRGTRGKPRVVKT